MVKFETVAGENRLKPILLNRGIFMSNGNQQCAHTLPNDGQVFPDHLIDVVWNHLKWSQLDTCMPWSEMQLSSLIYPAFQASLSSEEGLPARLGVAFYPIKPEQFTVQFAEPLPYTVGELVKLSPSIGLGSRWVVALPDETDLEQVQIAGILDPDILPSNRTHQRGGHGLISYQDQVQGLQIAILGPGWIRVSTTSTSFELRNCCLRERLVVHRIKYVGDWLCEIPSYLEISDAIMGIALSRRFFVNVLDKISEARHGGCLLILPERLDPSSLPLQIKYRVNSKIVQEAIKERASVGPQVIVQMDASEQKTPSGSSQIVHDDATLADALLLDRDLAQVIEFVAALATVDGAVVLSRDLKLEGFGAEITLAGLPSTYETVEYGNPPPPLGKPSPAPLADFGMRHRSAIRFCQEVPGAMAVVVSQDGGIRLFHRVGGRVRQWVELSAEEW
jgi:hypothetical protein